MTLPLNLTAARTTGCALLAGILLYSGFAAGQTPASTPVFVTEARLVPIEDRIEALGTLRANESVELTTSVTETVTALHFDDGDRVESGRVLVEMTSAEEHARLDEARATVAEARRQYQRIKSLMENQTASESLLDQRKREWETGKAQLAAIESHLADRLVRAPFSGVVGLRNVSVGTLVKPGDIITTLDDDGIMKLDFSVPVVYLDALAPGLPVSATTPARKGHTFEGSVKSIDSRVDPVTRSVIVRALLPNPDHALRPGMLLRVELLNRRREAIVIPEECLMPQGTEQFVFVVDRTEDNTVEQRAVGIGTRLPGRVEITDGLAAGEWVITDGTLKVRAGSKVDIRAIDDGSTPIHELLETRPVDTPAP